MNDFVSIQYIQDITGYSKRYVREKVLCAPDFPEAKLNFSAKTRRWSKHEIDEWFRCLCLRGERQSARLSRGNRSASKSLSPDVH